MTRTDFCSYVDVFYGNGETDRFFEDGLASKWFYIKALCGNTIPHATLPFGKMSVGAYSGGYPTGYGTHYPNSCGGIQKLSDTHQVRGFSHLHQSGTGAIQYYYNYAITTPFYGEDISAIQKMHPLTNEEAKPGYYKAQIQDIICEMTVDKGVAIHKYSFASANGRVAIDFSNDGLSKIFGSRYFSTVKEPKLEIVSTNIAVFSGVFSGVQLHFCVKAEGKNVRSTLFCNDKTRTEKTLADVTDEYGVVFDFSSNEIILKVAYSTISTEKAIEEINGCITSFSKAKENAYDIWNENLSRFVIKTDDESLKQKFYSCLYHSLTKPCDLTGESVLGVNGDVVTDFATFWDQYKTVLPLIYLSYPQMSDKIVKGIVNISRTFNKICCSFGLSNILPCEEQAKMLGIFSLCDAYYAGIPSATKSVIDECVKRELSRDDYKTFLQTGFFERYTHILDVTDACLCVAEITEDESLKATLLSLAKNWRNAYGKDALMSEDSPYYEGDKYTYSFRLQKNMDERISLAGGKEEFTKMLDKFFGFGENSVKQLTYIGAGKEIDECKYHRFEGFNNECDMETPYAYIFANRHDRLCEILNECVTRVFGLGVHGLAGNNDSGGLTSIFIWNSLGIFPVSGSGEFLIGSPAFDEAQIFLSSGKTLNIRVNRDNKKQIYVDKVTFNNEPITNYKVSACNLMKGGTIEFWMK